MNQMQLCQMYNQMNKNNTQLMNQGMNNNYNMNMNYNNNDDKINICFSSMQGSRIVMMFDPDETVEGALKKYLLRVNLPQLINNIQGKMIFILSAQSLHFWDKRRLKDVSLALGNPN